MKSLQKVAVLGLGTMGHGIAQVFATAGCEVFGFDEHAGTRAGLRERIAQSLDAFVAARLVKPREVPEILRRIVVCDREEDAVRQAQFVTEAVREDLGVKQELFARLEGLVSERCILASNSSTYPVSASAARMRTPERALVTHWFNPPHIVPVVDVVPGPRTNEASTRATMALLKRIGKKPIRIRQELPGFLVNRIQVAVMREVWDLLERGVATPADIDEAVRGTMGFRLAAIGPLEVHDFGGLDIQAKVFANLAPEIRSSTELPRVVQELVAAGHYGAKTGQGFHSYPPKKLAAKRGRRDAAFLQLLQLLHPPQAK